MRNANGEQQPPYARDVEEGKRIEVASGSKYMVSRWSQMIEIKKNPIGGSWNEFFRPLGISGNGNDL